MGQASGDGGESRSLMGGQTLGWWAVYSRPALFSVQPSGTFLDSSGLGFVVDAEPFKIPQLSLATPVDADRN